MFLLFYLQMAYSSLVIRTPAELEGTVLETAKASFGSPSFYPQLGRLFFIPECENCSVSNYNLTDYIAVLPNLTQCHISHLAFSAQTSGAIGAMFVHSSDNINFVTRPGDHEIAKLITIPVIGIANSSEGLLNSYKNYSIWVTYHNVFPLEAVPFVEFCMSGNYSQDKLYLPGLMDAFSTLGSSAFRFSLSLSYYNSSNPYIDPDNDCFNSSLCLPGSSFCTGFEFLSNLILIFNYFDTFPSSNYLEFLDFLTLLYTECESNYSTSCFSALVQSSVPTTPQSSIPLTISALTPCMFINSVPTFWPNFTTSAICMGSAAPQESCPRCSSDCLPGSENMMTCPAGCNSSACGWANFTCISSNGCFDFMMDDDMCDPVCPTDPDCDPNRNTTCEKRCPNSEIQKGNCPSGCTGECFNLCNKNDYCSAQCLYSDLEVGFCSSVCTEDCLETCDRNYSSCPYKCSGGNISETNCPDGCSVYCCQTAQKFENSITVSSAAAVVVAMIIGVGM
jgi:hypothetical protein